VNVALCQTKVTADKNLNIATAREAVRAAAAQGAELVILPEIWNGPYATTAFPEYAESVPGGESTAMLSNVAKENKIWLVGGSVSERASDGRIFNTCAVYNPEGDLVAKHRKVHLFDIDVPGKITFKESDTLTGGDKITVFNTPFGRVGVGICYDIRFPELAQLMRDKGAVILAYPGAFNLTTGPAHWQLLQQARAVDNQLYVLTASPARDPESGGYQAWGHSTAVSPWGDIIATTDEKPGTVHTTLDLTRVGDVRSSIPTAQQKRADIYQLSAKI
jgi:omega-amidase